MGIVTSVNHGKTITKPHIWLWDWQTHHWVPNGSVFTPGETPADQAFITGETVSAKIDLKEFSWVFYINSYAIQEHICAGLNEINAHWFSYWNFLCLRDADHAMWLKMRFM